ncbi:MAG: hypothetical protein GY701_32230 [Sulfitobacter sp.]|nr:hypothetical protein [Sulfitobacter sp.]
MIDRVIPGPFQLARRAGCGGPDKLDSVGADWLRTVWAAAVEAAESGADEDTVHEVADGCVPIYTYRRWATFVDLAGWEEDLDDIGGGSGDMTQDAGVALYLIAGRLVAIALEEVLADA